MKLVLDIEPRRQSQATNETDFFFVLSASDGTVPGPTSTISRFLVGDSANVCVKARAHWPRTGISVA